MGSAASYNKTRFHKEPDWLRLARIDARASCVRAFRNAAADLRELSRSGEAAHASEAALDFARAPLRRRRSNRRTPHTMRINTATAIIASARRL
jgi:hypothetical protein